LSGNILLEKGGRLNKLKSERSAVKVGPGEKGVTGQRNTCNPTKQTRLRRRIGAKWVLSCQEKRETNNLFVPSNTWA